MNTTVVRLIIFISVFLSIVFLPWWLTLIYLIGLAFYFPLYLEIVFFGFLFDHLFLASKSSPYKALILTAVVLIVITFIRNQIRR